MTTIKGGPSTATNLEKLSQNLTKAAESLKESAAQQPVTGTDSAANAVFATSKFVETVSDAAAAGAQAAAAGAYLTAGVSGWVIDGMQPGGREVSRGVARGFGAIVETLPRVFGDTKQVTARELQGDPTGQRFAERTFGKAAAKLQRSADTMNAAWAAYGEALWHLSGGSGSLTLAAGNAAGVAGSLAKAAALTTSSAATRMGEYGLRLGAAAVHAAEAGAAGARELISLSAKFSAATANVLGHPDAAKAQPLVDGQLKQMHAELAALAKGNASLEAFVQPLLAK